MTPGHLVSLVIWLQVRGVRTFFGITFRCRAAVVTTGTFMNGRIWVGRQSMPAGRCDSMSFKWMHRWQDTHRPSVLQYVIASNQD